MYIRTENKIYQVESETCDKKGYYIGDYGVILKEQVIKQSENLEDLCDEFVYEKGCGANREKPMISKNDFRTLLEWYVECGFKVNTIYGAVWTSKGLIYVAKMNDKGELELI